MEAENNNQAMSDRDGPQRIAGMKYLLLLFVSFILYALVVLGVTRYYSPYVGGEEVAEYTAYITNGGRYIQVFHDMISRDKNRDRLFRGRTVAEVLSKYPDARSGRQYADGTYRSSVTRLYVSRGADDLIFIDPGNEFAFGWAIEVRNGVPVDLVLIKG